jgi:tetratricopeptide (TPR) repeat protein
LATERKAAEVGRQHLLRGEMAAAEKAFGEALAADPKDEHALLGMAKVLTEEGKRVEAIEVCERIADVYVERGREVKAVEVYARVLRLDPGRPESHRKLGELLHRLKRPKEAMAQLKSAAAAFRQRNHGEDDIPTLRRILELTPEPERSASRIELAEALNKIGRKKEALAEYREEARLLEAVAELEIMGNRGSARGGHAHRQLLEVLARVLQLDPGDVDSLLMQARFQLAGSPAKSLSTLQQVLKIDKTNLSALKLLDNAFLALGQTDKAALAYDQISKLDASYGKRVHPDPTSLSAELAQIDAFMAQDLPHKAMEAARSLVGAHPDSFEARMKLKQLFLKVSDTEGAITELSVLVNLAIASSEIGYARTILQELLRLSPGHPRVRECCVQVAERLFARP